ncbi:MAG TPA: hypothetical protein VNJ03_18305 [Vicinamibacterales bacterium]|nr:hypothetical protein [Vicinamibacterales bacterium]
MAFAAGLVPVAQTASPTQTAAPGVPPQGTPGAQPPGRGGGRGGGGPDVLAGGPQLDDPAYASVDFTKRTPIPALTPEQQLTRFILHPGYRLELVLSALRALTHPVGDSSILPTVDSGRTIAWASPASLIGSPNSCAGRDPASQGWARR